jgi:hypothetical protein
MAEQSLVPIDRAKQKVRDLNSEVPAFLKRYRCRVVVKRDTQTVDSALTAIFEPGHDYFDGPIPTLVRDALGNLRTALDGAVAAKVRQKGGNPHGAHFPVVANVDDLEIAIQKALVERAGPEVVSFVRRLEPYPGGDGELLWAACRASLNLQGLTQARYLGYLVAIEDGITNKRTGVTTPVLVPFADNYVYWHTHATRAKIDVPVPEADFEVNDEIEATFDIALLDGLPLAGEPILEALSECVRAVAGTLDRIRDL